MNTLFILYSTAQLVRNIAPTVPPEVQQLVNQLEAQTGQILTDVAHYGLLIASLASAIVLLLSSLLLMLHYPPMKTVQPKLRLIRSVSTNQQSRHPAENRVARANRDEFRLVSAQIRAGQRIN